MTAKLMKKIKKLKNNSIFIQKANQFFGLDFLDEFDI